MLNSKEEIDFFKNNVVDKVLDETTHTMLIGYGNGIARIEKRIKKHLKNVHTFIVPLPHVSRFYYYGAKPHMTDRKYATNYKNERLRIIYFELDDELKTMFRLYGYDTNKKSILYIGAAHAVGSYILDTYKPNKYRQYSFLPASFYAMNLILQDCLEKEDKFH